MAALRQPAEHLEGLVLTVQRPICSFEPATQCEEAGTAGIRQITTLTCLSRPAGFGRPGRGILNHGPAESHR